MTSLRATDLARFVASRPMGGSHILRAGSLPWVVVAWSPAADQTGSAGTEAALEPRTGPTFVHRRPMDISIQL